MDFRFSPEDERFRQEVRDFLKDELPPDWLESGIDAESDDEAWEFAGAFRKKLATQGWLVGYWPKDWGGGDWPLYKQTILNEEFSYFRAPRGEHHGINLVGPTIMAHGTEEQKRRFLPPIANSEVIWAQLFSEPNAGSDLASLQTRAEDHGDYFIINGQKCWNTYAQRSQWGILLARTDPTAPKHKGISCFLVDLTLPGIKIQPLMTMANSERFSQSFYDNVRVPRSCLVGPKNQGWYVAANTLNMERSAIAAAMGALRTVQELVRYAQTARWAGRSVVEVNPAIRHRLAETMIEVQVCRMLSYRVAWMQNARMPFSAQASLAKLFTAELGQRVARVAVELTGLYGQVHKGSPHAQLRGKPPQSYLTTVSRTIGGGTSEIMRTTLAQRGLGLQR